MKRPTRKQSSKPTGKRNRTTKRLRNRYTRTHARHAMPRIQRAGNREINEKDIGKVYEFTLKITDNSFQTKFLTKCVYANDEYAYFMLYPMNATVSADDYHQIYLSGMNELQFSSLEIFNRSKLIKLHAEFDKNNTTGDIHYKMAMGDYELTLKHVPVDYGKELKNIKALPDDMQGEVHGWLK